MEKEFFKLQQENDSLVKHITLLESKSVNSQEKENLLMQLDRKHKF